MTDLIKLRLGRDLRQSSEYGKFMGEIGWKTFTVKGDGGQVLVHVRKVGPVSIAKSRRTYWPFPWKGVKEVLKQEKTLIYRVDSETDRSREYKKMGFKEDRQQLVGAKTLLIDLRPREEDVMAGFKTETRYKLRKLERDNHKIKLGDFARMYEIIKEGYKDINLWCPPPKQYYAMVNAFAKKCFCLTVDDNSGCVAIIYKGVAEYYFASATKAGKAVNAPYLVAWETMREAKRRGAKVWDFNGVYDERWPDKRWKGFSFFKERFGGVPLLFPGSLTAYRLLANW